MRHKHADIIMAWALGHSIQGQSPSTDEWIDVPDIDKLGEQFDGGDAYLAPNPLHPEYDWWPNWRVKP